MPLPMVSYCHVAPYFDHLDIRSEMVSLMTLPTACNISTDANSVTWQKHVAPHFSSLDLRNAMMLMMMLSVLHNVNASTNSFT